jgi:hypothetical protein
MDLENSTCMSLEESSANYYFVFSLKKVVVNVAKYQESDIVVFLQKYLETNTPTPEKNIILGSVAIKTHKKKTKIISTKNYTKHKKIILSENYLYTYL